MSGTIPIEVNGEARQVPDGASVHDLLSLIGLAAPKVAVERNLEIVPRSAWASTRLGAGDRVSGPAVIVERETASIVTSRFDAVIQGDGSILLIAKEPRA